MIFGFNMEVMTNHFLFVCKFIFILGIAICAAGPVPSCQEGARRLLEGLQSALYWRSGRTSSWLPAYTQ
jgi:hypothetical protein